MSLDDELIQAFLEESRENLDQLDLDLVALETTPNDVELLGRVFRTIHTIKGTCGFLNYANLESLAHAGEDLLALLRDGRLTLDPPITSSLLGLVDRIRAVLAVVERTGTEGDFDHSTVIADLRRHAEGEPPTTSTAANPQAPPEAVAAPAAVPDETTVRIDVEVLDRLQDLVGELTLARLRVSDHVPDDGALAHAFHQLTVTARDLQDTVMQARLQPVSTVTDRLRRIVRDLAAREGKVVDLQIDGADVLVDKAINEILRDPLVHLVRNAVDHGIELPEMRAAQGKDVQATLRIEAAVIGGGFQIEVTDDGRGIDGARLVDRAMVAGLLTGAEAATLTDDQRLALLFLPGVSTAEEVTTVSGRGVGMDVVRSNLEQIGGNIDVWSERGMGTTFRISVPLTLAILPALVVECGAQRYTIPQADVLAVVHVPVDDVDTVIDHVGGARFLHHHEALLPLLDLADYLGLPRANPSRDLEIVVIERLDRTYALVVDAVGDTVEAVVKPLPRALRGLGCYAGVTVLADGQPSLILETSAPAIDAGLHPQPAVPAQPETDDPARQPLLTAAIGHNRVALPVARVARLLQVPATALERSGHDETLQHQTGIIPVIHLDRVLGIPHDPHREDLTVIVCDSQNGQVGLVVDDVFDIERANPADAEALDEPCLQGRLVVAGKVTDLLAVDEAVSRGLQMARTRQAGEHV